MADMFMPVYNVTNAVGPNQPNASDDVRLVQTLFGVMRNLPWVTGSGLARLGEDGVYTPLVSSYILVFQNVLGSSHVARDGIIHPIQRVNGLPVNNIGSYHSTLMMLNYNCMMQFPAQYVRLAEALHLRINPPR
jgi:hypothetical protein